MEAYAAMLTAPAAYGLAFVLGALFGSFANVCIYRWPPTDEHPRGRSVVTPGSHCGACGAPIAWYDNVPLLSYLWLRGKCRACAAEFSPRYLFVEAVTAILFVAIYHLTIALAYGGAAGQGVELALLRTLIYWSFAFVMVIVVFIDLDHMLILNKVTFPSAVLFYGLGLLLPENHWSDGLYGAAVGFGVVWLIANGWALIAGRKGMGAGDAKLLAVVGALLGWKAPVFALFAGSFIGLILNLPLLVGESLRRRREAKAAPSGDGAAREGEGGDAREEEENDEEDVAIGKLEVPFGPALVIASLIYLFLDEAIESQFRLTLSLLW